MEYKIVKRAFEIYNTGKSSEEVAKIFNCSRRCLTINFKKYGFKTRKSGASGEKSGKWKGGITKFRKILRKTKEYTLWRLKVFERDSFTCQRCRIYKKNLQAHHIITKKEIFKKFNIKTVSEALKCELLWDTNNGITYCRKCHQDIHTLRKNIKFSMGVQFELRSE